MTCRIISVHRDTPHLAVGQAELLRRQVGADYHFTIIDNGRDLEEPKRVYAELLEEGLVSEVFCLDSIKTHGAALDDYFSTEVFDAREDYLAVMDSDCFLTAPSSLETLCREVDVAGTAGARRDSNGLMSFGVYLLVAKTHDMYDAWEHTGGFSSSTWNGGESECYWDTGTKIAVSLMTPRCKHTEAPFKHCWQGTVLAASPWAEKDHAERNHKSLEDLFIEHELGPVLERFRTSVPSMKDWFGSLR